MKRWPLNKALFWESSPFFRLLLPFATGILCYYKGWMLLPAAYTTVIFAAVFSVFAVLTRAMPGKAPRAIIFLLINTMLLLGGNACAWYGDARNDKNWFGNLQNSGASLVRITEQPTLRATSSDYIWRIPVQPVATINTARTQAVTGSALLYVHNDSSIRKYKKGDTILLPNKWEHLKNAGNPFEFDYAAYCAYKGLCHRQFTTADKIALYARGSAADISLTQKVHNWCMHQLETYIPDIKTAALIEAMILGDEVNIDEGTRELYAETGIIHIIAISGGNVAIFFIIISFLLWWLKNKKHQWIKYAIALPLVWFYVIMAGAAPSAIRAAVMFSLIAFAIMFQKNNNSLNGLFATAFLLLLAQPAWLFSLGFQLSFVAVLSLMLFYRHIQAWVSPRNKIVRLFWNTAAASIAAQILVAPLIIYYFHSFPLLFIIANAAAYIFMGAVLVLSIVVLVVSPVPLVASFIARCLIFLVAVFDKLLQGLQYFSPRSFQALLLSGVEMLLVYVIIAAISVFLLQKKKQGLFLALGTTCVLLCLFNIDKWRHLKQEYLVVYNLRRDGYIELLRADSCRQVTKPYSQNAGYAFTPVHIYKQTRILHPPDGKMIFKIAGQSVLVLGHHMRLKGTFPVDVLVINYVEADLRQLIKIFSPRTVVIGGNCSQKQQEQLVKIFADVGVAVHAVAINGAYVLQN